MNDRGHYGPPRVGAVPPQPTTVYVEGKGASTTAWVLGIAAVGGALLWARHQSQQIEQLYKTSGMSYQTFAGSLRESAKAIPSRAREAYRGIAARVRPTRAIPATSAEQPAHSVKARR